ncbi:MAG: nucleotidyl transferase AbiEii/AbiGii toxin family protein [Actinomycetota bacterium]
MSRGRSYSDPGAFRRALKDRLRSEARDSKWTIQQLQRQFAFDRLLERLYLVDSNWIVKGATALLARDIGVRGSLDIDVYREKARGIAEAELREAATKDIGDWFRFELGPSQAATDGAKTTRIPVQGYVGLTVWAQFHVDLVGADLRMTGQPEEVPPLVSVLMPDVEQHGYVAYPLVDHVADKVAATFELRGEQQRPSTRYRDLVDLVSIAAHASVPAEELQKAIESEAARRGIKLPEAFDVPDREMWKRGYEAEARRSLLTFALTLEEAIELVRKFIDPILNGILVGAWDPDQNEWIP